MTSLLFQLSADVLNVDTLLNRIRNTSLTDHITYGSQTQALHLINPAGYIKAYLMPNALPAHINAGTLNDPGQTLPLNKGFYKGVLFDIPGAEVKIGGQWIPYNSANRYQIIAQNPLNLEWRLNGQLLKKLGKKGQTVSGTLIVVDDQCNGLSITKPFSIQVN